MKRAGCLLALFATLASSTAAAQYAPPPPPSQTPYAPPAYQYQPPPVQLTPDEVELLNKGPISEGAHLGGGIVAFMFGLGIGHAVQGRWSEKGWIFTLGELAAGTLMIYGLTRAITSCHDDDFEVQCDNDGLGEFAVGAIALTGFRIWEVVDAFAGPASHNQRYRNLQMRLGGYQQPRYGLYVSPTMDRSTGVAGLSLRF